LTRAFLQRNDGAAKLTGVTLKRAIGPVGAGPARHQITRCSFRGL
jgi:hypothetical protein